MSRHATGAFSQRVWSGNADLIGAIHQLPFNRELASGTLATQRFTRYLAQDRLYLRRYGRALSLCAAKSPDEGAVDFFARSAHVAIAVERSMHAGLLDRLGVTERQLAEHGEMSPACQAYTDFLIAACYEQPYAVAVAAVLPCFWIYEDIGVTIAKHSARDNPYQPWVDTYSDPSFEEAVRTAIRLVDEAADESTEATRQSMDRFFRRSTQYEWMFWDSAYRLEAWPV